MRYLFVHSCSALLVCVIVCFKGLAQTHRSQTNKPNYWSLVALESDTTFTLRSDKIVKLWIIKHMVTKIGLAAAATTVHCSSLVCFHADNLFLQTPIACSTTLQTHKKSRSISGAAFLRRYYQQFLGRQGPSPASMAHLLGRICHFDGTRVTSSSAEGCLIVIVLVEFVQ